MCALRRICVLVVLAMVLMLALSAVPAAAAPGLMMDRASGLPPCRQAQLMAAECQLEHAQLSCVKIAKVGWRCDCGPSPSHAAVWMSSDPEVPCHARHGGLIAK